MSYWKERQIARSAFFLCVELFWQTDKLRPLRTLELAMAKRALKLSEVATLSDSVIETDEAMERMETDEPESLTEYRIKQAPDASANRRRTTPEQRAAILQDLADGMSRKDASVKHNTILRHNYQY